jgi:signal peptidase II
MVKPKFFTIVFAVVLLDQFTKFFFDRLVSREIILIPDFLSFSKVYNSGAGWGLMHGQRWLLVWVSVVVIGGILYCYHDLTKKRLSLVGTALVLGGALGNLIDRVFFGFVFDFIGFSFWPSFNLADSCISIGAVLLLVSHWKKKKKKKVT